jgi:hypothetical protein
MLIEKLIAADAAARIAAATARGGRVHGVDGFHVVPNGFVASLDLVLDLSNRPLTQQRVEAFHRGRHTTLKPHIDRLLQTFGRAILHDGGH